MPTRIWRVLALVCATIALAIVVGDMVMWTSYGDLHVGLEPADGRSSLRLLVDNVTGTPAENGGLQPGDIVTNRDGFNARLRLGALPAGTRLNLHVERGTTQFDTSIVTTVPAESDLVLIEIYNVVRLAMILVALLLVVRRPESPAARALVSFLVALGLTLIGVSAWLPERAFAIYAIAHWPIQIFGLAEAVEFACIFPFPSSSGPRAVIRRLNPWLALLIAVQVTYMSTSILVTGIDPLPASLIPILKWDPLYFFATVTAAFWISAAMARGEDKQRVRWAFGSIGIGFIGPLLQTFMIGLFHRADGWANYLALTLIAIPLGLAYTILRHRTIDMGFVVSRALVLTIVSFIIVAALGLLERALGKLFIDASHIASRTAELALAIGLGFSLRTLHAYVERAVDRLFFRKRRHAIATLKSFAQDIYHITDLDAAVERTVDTVVASTGAANAAIYLIADGGFGCAAAADPRAFPAEVDENDPLFVRLRSIRSPEAPHAVASAVLAEIAFPMFVRGTLVGAVVLAPKRSGEAYDPEESGLLADLAQRLGIALDALQTIAMRRELEALIATYDRPKPALNGERAGGRSATGGAAPAF